MLEFSFIVSSDRISSRETFTDSGFSSYSSDSSKTVAFRRGSKSSVVVQLLLTNESDDSLASCDADNLSDAIIRRVPGTILFIFYQKSENFKFTYSLMKKNYRQAGTELKKKKKETTSSFDR